MTTSQLKQLLKGRSKMRIIGKVDRQNGWQGYLTGGPTNPIGGKGPITIIAADVAYPWLEVDEVSDVSC